MSSSGISTSSYVCALYIMWTYFGYACMIYMDVHAQILYECSPHICICTLSNFWTHQHVNRLHTPIGLCVTEFTCTRLCSSAQVWCKIWHMPSSKCSTCMHVHTYLGHLSAQHKYLFRKITCNHILFQNFQSQIVLFILYLFNIHGFEKLWAVSAIFILSIGCNEETHTCMHVCIKISGIHQSAIWCS